MRKDGKKVKANDAEYAVVPHIMVERSDSCNQIVIDIPLEPIQKYLNQKRKEGVRLSHLAVLLAAYCRVLGQYPMLNRFVVNKRIYARNEFVVAMVVLKGGKMDNGTMSKVNLLPSDDIFTVNRKMLAYIDRNKESKENNKTDKLAGTLIGVPGLLRFGVNFLKFLDWHNLLPLSIIEASPFHASLTISNLASIRTGHIFHHIYNFGTTSVFITMGKPREIACSDENGEVVLEKTLPLGIVMDERICSGSYYAQAFRTFSKYLENPALLEQSPKEEDVIYETPYRKTKEFL